MDVGDMMFDPVLLKTASEVEPGDGEKEEWEQCLIQLRSEDDHVRQKAATKLRQEVDTMARKLSTDTFEKWEKGLHRRVFNLLKSEVCLFSSRLFLVSWMLLLCG